MSLSKYKKTLKEEIIDINARIDGIREYDSGIIEQFKIAQEEIEMLQEYNQAARSLKGYYEKILLDRELDLRKVSLEGII